MSLPHPNEALNAATNTTAFHGGSGTTTTLLHHPTTTTPHEESTSSPSHLPSPSKPYEHVLQLHHVHRSTESNNSDQDSNQSDESSLPPPPHTLNELLETAEHAVKDKIEVVLPDEKR
ncbi:hypothetical protein FDP41_010989 [Naegleria fowleri]|uniref:Uncharacterized protein n=1 Tax=Naegleria fowleri TaxID=5763 RepID=A0A6A5C7B3_NAEFO|nr:uncharacterized protein FDP41_010989 [Naegleria fowleri]KAF0983011.1 hypothetical protein FDP41_010989 [Naegleria fowleri]